MTMKGTVHVIQVQAQNITQSTYRLACADFIDFQNVQNAETREPHQLTVELVGNPVSDRLKARQGEVLFQIPFSATVLKRSNQSLLKLRSLK
jgi:hypothetical protein